MADYLRDKDEDTVCGNQCILSDRRWKVVGYVSLRPAGAEVPTRYYGSMDRFGRCGSGGEM